MKTCLEFLVLISPMLVLFVVSLAFSCLLLTTCPACHWRKSRWAPKCWRCHEYVSKKVSA
jgi:apolipoprotein N-acyltransferase